MLKTILFSTDPKVIEDYQKQGDVIIAKDPIKTLKAMKKLGNKEEYQVVGDDKYVEFSKRIGYNKPEKKIPPLTVSKLMSFYEDQLKEQEQQLKEQERDFADRIQKLKTETDGLRISYDKKVKELGQEFEQKKAELESEKTEIKDTIKNIINAPI